MLNQLTGRGCGVILASSELPEVLAMSDRVIVMYRGRIRAVLERDQIDRDLVMALATGVEPGERKLDEQGVTPDAGTV